MKKYPHVTNKVINNYSTRWVGMIRYTLALALVLLSACSKSRVIQSGSKSINIKSLAFQKSIELDTVLINGRREAKAAVWQWKNNFTWIVMQTKNDSFAQSCEAWAGNDSKFTLIRKEPYCTVMSDPIRFPLEGTSVDAVYWRVKIRQSSDAPDVDEVMTWIPDSLTGSICMSPSLESAIAQNVLLKQHVAIKIGEVMNDMNCMGFK